MALSGVLTETQIVGAFQTPDPAVLPLPANPVKVIPLDAANGVLSGGNVGLQNMEFSAFSPASGRAVLTLGSTAGGLDVYLNMRIALL
jgi:hypothetical protein